LDSLFIRVLVFECQDTWPNPSTGLSFGSIYYSLLRFTVLQYLLVMRVFKMLFQTVFFLDDIFFQSPPNIWHVARALCWHLRCQSCIPR